MVLKLLPADSAELRFAAQNGYATQRRDAEEGRLLLGFFPASIFLLVFFLFLSLGFFFFFFLLLFYFFVFSFGFEVTSCRLRGTAFRGTERLRNSAGRRGGGASFWGFFRDSLFFWFLSFFFFLSFVFSFPFFFFWFEVTSCRLRGTAFRGTERLRNSMGDAEEGLLFGGLACLSLLLVSFFFSFFWFEVTSCRLRGTSFRGTERLRNSMGRRTGAASGILSCLYFPFGFFFFLFLFGFFLLV